MFEVWANSEIVNKRAVKKFINYFARDDNWHKLDKNRGGLGYGWIHYSLIRLLRPERVLCVGSKYGFIPAICALACKDNGGGLVDFVDAGYDMNNFKGPGQHWGGVGLWERCDPKKYFREFGLRKFIRLYVMKSEDYCKKMKKEKYGYIHIDGDHSYKGVSGDFKRFWPMLKMGGFMAIHDIGSPDFAGIRYGTRKFWKEIKKSGKFRTIEMTEDPGVGIIQKE